MKKVAEEKAFVSGLRHDRTKQLEEESAWRKNLAVHEEYIRKEISAKALRRALQSSVELSRSSLLEEKQMKVLQRSASTAKVARLSEETSTQVIIAVHKNRCPSDWHISSIWNDHKLFLKLVSLQLTAVMSNQELIQLSMLHADPSPSK